MTGRRPWRQTDRHNLVSIPSSSSTVRTRGDHFGGVSRGEMISLLCFAAFSATAVASAASFALPEGADGGTLPNGGKIWAVLAAGSTGWANYRHQADVCHAYQVLRSHGIPDEQIVVFMYDDIANNEENPYPGVIVNRPNGPNVYEGVPKDYTGDRVNPDNFLAVLKGERNRDTVGRKIIQSGPKDHIFVFFADHGSPGFVGFPDDYLGAKELNEAILEMHEAQKFDHLVLYIEACESGSMFDGLLHPNINVYATTASNSTASSWACYFDKETHTYLGDVYSVLWMQDSDREDIEVETLGDQFARVKKMTTTSTVKEFGDLSMKSMKVGDFQGRQEKGLGDEGTVDPCLADAVPSYKVPRILLERKVQAARTPASYLEAKQELETYVAGQVRLERLMEEVTYAATGGDHEAAASVLSGPKRVRDHDCNAYLLRAFRDLCPQDMRHDYATRAVFALANICSEGHSSARAITAMQMACNHVPDVVVS